MKPHLKEIRDPIHNFIHVDKDEIRPINSLINPDHKERAARFLQEKHAILP